MRVPYAILAIEVDKLYAKQFAPGDEVALDEHLHFIEEYILACGWTPDEYIQAYIASGELTNDSGDLRFQNKQAS